MNCNNNQTLKSLQELRFSDDGLLEVKTNTLDINIFIRDISRN